MDDLDAGVFEGRKKGLRITPGCFYEFYSTLHDHAHEFFVRHVPEGREDREVHGKRFVGHLPAACDLPVEILGRGLSKSGDDAQAARVRDRRDKLCVAYVVHPALDDGMLDAEQFSDARLHQGKLTPWEPSRTSEAHRKRQRVRLKGQYISDVVRKRTVPSYADVLTGEPPHNGLWPASSVPGLISSHRKRAARSPLGCPGRSSRC